MDKKICIVVDDPSLNEIAKLTSRHLHLPIVIDPKEYDLLIGFSLTCIYIKNTITNHTFYVNYASKEHQFRNKRLKDELLLKAIGHKKNKVIKVIDAMSGFGKDAFVLLSSNCNVILLERSPLVHILLQDGLTRYFQNKVICYNVDAADYIKNIPNDQKPDVIYLDPLRVYLRKHTAKSGKEIEFLKVIGYYVEDFNSLLELSLTKAKHRVVVKSAIQAQENKYLPDLIYKGNNTKFNVYFPRS